MSYSAVQGTRKVHYNLIYFAYTSVCYTFAQYKHALVFLPSTIELSRIHVFATLNNIWTL